MHFKLQKVRDRKFFVGIHGNRIVQPFCHQWSVTKALVIPNRRIFFRIEIEGEITVRIAITVHERLVGIIDSVTLFCSGSTRDLVQKSEIYIGTHSLGINWCIKSSVWIILNCQWFVGIGSYLFQNGFVLLPFSQKPDHNVRLDFKQIINIYWNIRVRDERISVRLMKFTKYFVLHILGCSAVNGIFSVNSTFGYSNVFTGIWKNIQTEIRSKRSNGYIQKFSYIDTTKVTVNNNRYINRNSIVHGTFASQKRPTYPWEHEQTGFLSSVMVQDPPLWQWISLHVMSERKILHRILRKNLVASCIH